MAALEKLGFTIDSAFMIKPSDMEHEAGRIGYFFRAIILYAINNEITVPKFITMRNRMYFEIF